MRGPERLKKRAEFLRVAGRGRKIAMPGLILQVLPTEAAAGLRAGFTVTRKVGNAVVRNRTRRRLKEALRLLAAGRDLAGADIVLVGRDATRRLPFATLKAELETALGRGRVL